MVFAKMLPIVLLIMLVPGLAGAQQRQFGNTVYSLPPGWTTGRDDDGVLVILSELPNDRCEFCYLYLSASKPGSGDVVAYLNREKLRFVDEEDKAGATAVDDPSEITVAGHPAAMMALNIGTNIQVVVAVSLGDRFELLGFQGSGTDDAARTESLTVLQEQIVPFFETLTFVSAGAKPLLPSPQPGDMDGVWWGWSTSTSFGLDMMMRQDINYRKLLFWPDGYFYDGTPPDGLAPLHPDDLQSRADPNYGVYIKSGDRLTLSFASGEVETLTAKGKDWQDSQKTLTQVQPLADGTVLVGGISSFFSTGFTPGTGLEGGISSSSSTEFFADGTYRGESFGGAFASFDGGGGFSSGNDGADGGHYVVQGGLVISTPDDGSAPKAALALRVDDENIMIGDQFLEVAK